MGLIICFGHQPKTIWVIVGTLTPKPTIILKYALYVCKEKCLFTNLYEFMSVQKI